MSAAQRVAAQFLARQGAGRVTRQEFKVKNGDVVPQGTPVSVRFLGPRDLQGSSLCTLAFNWTGPSGTDYVEVPVRVAILRLPLLVTGFAKPTYAMLERWSMEGVGKTPTGKTTEPDGYAPDGSPSWMLVMGLI